ncbi:hypothetical protein B5G04_01215 [Bacteroides sp. An51A]|nr:hypothetical protein B5G04_01215 [Bacteroides sp. An51A]
MRKIAGYLTKNRSEKDQKIAQSTHENGYIKPRKTFWRNSKQLLNILKMPVDKRSVRKYIPVLPQSHIVRTAVLDSIGLQYQ